MTSASNNISLSRCNVASDSEHPCTISNECYLYKCRERQLENVISVVSQKDLELRHAQLGRICAKAQTQE